MSQGFARIKPTILDTEAQSDAFSRLRVSTPTFVFDQQLTYGLAPLIFEPLTNGSGAAVAHDATNRCATLTLSSTPTGGYSIMQSFEHVRYQPGRSQLAFITFCFIEPVANVIKFAGLSDGSNGIEFRLDGSTNKIALLSDTGNGDQIISQSSWNLDKLDGTGPSAITLDNTKTQILAIDFQALYVGIVKVGFDIGGVIVWAHAFYHANVIAVPYIQTANLPVRAGMTCTGTVSTTMRFICCSVMSEGGQEDVGGYAFSIGGSVNAGSGARTHVVSVRPKTAFNSITNRSKFVLESVDCVVTGANPVLFEVCFGQAISGTTAFNDVNATYSAFEYNTAGTISGSPAIVAVSLYAASSNVAKSAAQKMFSNRYPVTLDAAGAVRALGTITAIATGIGGASDCRVALNWREIR